MQRALPFIGLRLAGVIAGIAWVALSVPAPALRAEDLAELSPPSEAELDPAATLEADGSITLTDGSSYYTFSKGGDFTSGPVGTSGRTLDGRWSQPAGSKGRFVVVARRGWIGGISSGSFHRIVFDIRPGKKKPLHAERIPAIMEFSTYFLIEEFVEIPEPALGKKAAD